MIKKGKIKNSGSTGEDIEKKEGVAIDEIVDSIKRAIILTQGDIESSGIKIKRIELKLKSIASEKAGADIKLQVPILGEFKIGSDLSSKSVQTTSLILKTSKIPIKVVNKMFKLDEKLAENILSLTKGIKAAAINQPPLEMEESLVELNFVLKSESEVSFLIKAGFESELTNTLKIVFEKI